MLMGDNTLQSDGATMWTCHMVTGEYPGAGQCVPSVTTDHCHHRSTRIFRLGGCDTEVDPGHLATPPTVHLAPVLTTITGHHPAYPDIVVW